MSSSTTSLPWLPAAVAATLPVLRSHAVLVVAPAGTGELEFISQLAMAGLCEGRAPSSAPTPQPACGQCAACRQFLQGAHPDVFHLLPEALRGELATDADAEGGRTTKRKPSTQIKIDEARAAIDWMSRTSSRGRGKWVLVHPAESLNLHSASALLKNLEEPAEGVTLLLTVSDPERVLPTIRSRCQLVRMPLPSRDDAAQWLRAQGVAQGDVLLDAAAGRPLLALAMAQGGWDAERWAQLPGSVARGDAGALAGMDAAAAVDTLLKLCHDAWSLHAGGVPSYFPANSLKPAKNPQALPAWHRDLLRVARQAQHPWNEGLLLEALLIQAQKPWQSSAIAHCLPPGGGPKLPSHERPRPATAAHRPD